MKKTNTNETAAQDYAANSKKVETMLERLNDRLANHEKDANAAPKSWGYSGDLARVEELLAQAVAALGGMGECELRKRGI